MMEKQLGTQTSEREERKGWREQGGKKHNTKKSQVILLTLLHP